MRAHLVMNPEARGVTPAMKRVVVAALEASFKLEVSDTYARGLGIEAASRAVDAGVDYLIAFGGDGLVNEVANAAARSGAVMALIPGGTMNVFARNLGIPRDPVEATDRILQAAGRVAPREVSLGRAGDRLFTFSCGCGFDAEAAQHVEANKAAKRRVGEPYFYAVAMLTFLRRYSRRQPFLRVSGGFAGIKGVLAIGLMGPTYAYLAGRRVQFGRPASAGLSLFVLERLLYRRVPTYAVSALGAGSFGPEARFLSGVPSFRVQSEEPFGFHVDGEPMPARDDLEVVGSAATLRILA